MEGSSNSRLALMIGAVVCIAISNAGTCSQDLKTGFLVGSTPVRQQTALLIGVLTSVLAVGWTAYLLNLANTRETHVSKSFTVPRASLERAEDVESREDHATYAFVRLTSTEVPTGEKEGTYLVDRATAEARYRRDEGIGSERFPAPQSRLMSVVIDGLLTHKIPWDLILLGAAIALFMELLDIRSLTFAVGVYLPLSTTMPVFLGGLVRKLADLAYHRPPDAEDETQGTLISSGIIAGASIVGIFAALQAFLPGYDADSGFVPNIAVLGKVLPESLTKNNVYGLAILALLGFVMWRGAADPKKS